MPTAALVEVCKALASFSRQQEPEEAHSANQSLSFVVDNKTTSLPLPTTHLSFLRLMLQHV
jgi:hypothetical protein